MKNNIRVILFTNKKTGEVEFFSSLKPFYEKYQQFEAHSDSIDSYLSRKKKQLLKTMKSGCNGSKCSGLYNCT